MEGRQRVTVYNQMSGLDSSQVALAGLTLNAVLANQKRISAPPTNQRKSRTLLDIIKEDENNKKDRKSWKAFKDKLRLKRAGSAWTSSIHIPTSDPILTRANSRNNNFSQFERRNSDRSETQSNSDMASHYNAHQVENLDPYDDSVSSPGSAAASKPQFSRRSSTRFGSPMDSGDDSGSGGGGLRAQLSRRNSTNMPSQSSETYKRGRVVTFRDNFEDDDSDEDEMNPVAGRTLSAREAVAAQEASEAAAAEAEHEAGQPMMMSLMDLLEETDREMGLEGSRYILSDDDFDDEEEEVVDVEDGEGAMEYTCCVCMVKHKGAAFAPCGHTFCRMCSRELNVSRGNCPLCNNFILEILEIF
ncbi:hypothetical protein RIF29_29468 [Crotalaria pallida]|uniref:RING-type domain-containing protein n=1 Tax=Crotalaria pallida TaxID=3830 RepID=A0AAN9EGY8_CROPI